MINSHVHVFNLKTILTPSAVEIIKDRLRRQIGIPVLGEAVAEVVGDGARDLESFSEERLLRSLLDRLVGEDAVRDAVGRFTDSISPELGVALAGEVERLALLELRRALDSLGNVFRRDSDARRSTLFDVVEFLRIATKSEIVEVAHHLMRQLDADVAVVPLLMDIIAAGADHEEQFLEQIEGTFGAALAYPGRVLPLAGLNTNRADHFDRLREQVDEKGFIGVKLYPSLGYPVTGDAMERVYDLCLAEELPLLMHCNEGGFYASEDDIQNGNPELWDDILIRHPGLRICFAHFGGGGELESAQFPQGWTATILDLMRAHAGVYADISFHTGPMEGGAPERRYFDNLEGVLADPVLGDRVLWGTDYWLVRTRLSETNHWRFFERRLGESFERIAVDNPQAFWGFADGVASGANLRRHVETLVAHADDLTGPPARWVLETVAREHPALRERFEQLAESFAPSRELRIPDFLDRLSEVAAEALASNQPIEVAKELGLLGSSLRLAGERVGLRAGAELSVLLFDDEETEDPDGVLVAEPDEEALAPPHLRYTPDAAWLKYRVEGNLRLEAAGTLAAAGINASAGLTAVMADYRRHGRDERTADAIARDLSRPRFALSRGDVLRLGRGEALLFRTTGSLEATLSIAWADVFSYGLNELAKVLGGQEPVGIKVEAGARFLARVAVHDDFKLVVSRPREGDADRELRVSVLKAEARERSVGIAGGVTVGFEDPKGVERALGALLSQKLERAESTIRRIMGRTAATLTDAERTTLEHIAERLGVEGDDVLEKVQAEYARLEKELAEAVAKIARAKVELGFRYEYGRLEEGSVLVQASLSRVAMEELHHHLAAGHLSAMIERSRWDDQVELELLLRERRIERVSSWGFTLGIGAWSLIAQSSEKRVVFTARELETDGSRSRQLSYMGLRAFREGWGRSNIEIMADLRAEMPDFSRTETPLLSEFDVGIGLVWEWNNHLVNERRLAELYDAAELWGAVPGPGGAAQSEVLGELGGRRADLRLQLLIPPEALPHLLRNVRVADDDRFWARALAAAMPFARGNAVFADVATRRDAYEPLYRRFVAAVREPGFVLRVRDWAFQAAEHLEELGPGLRGQARRERRQMDAASLPDRFTMSGLLEMNETTGAGLVSFRNQLALLAAATDFDTTNDPAHGAFREIFEGLQSFWKQPHHVRTVGAYFLEHARTVGKLDELTRTLTVEWGEDGERQSWVIAGA